MTTTMTTTTKREHVNEAGLFQSDKCPECPPNWMPLSLDDPPAREALLFYLFIRKKKDAAFEDDLRFCIAAAGGAQESTPNELADWVESNGVAWRLFMRRQAIAAKLRRQEDACSEWRRGVLLIANAFDMEHACCATILEKVLEQQACIDKLKEENANLRSRPLASAPYTHGARPLPGSEGL